MWAMTFYSDATALKVFRRVSVLRIPCWSWVSSVLAPIILCSSPSALHAHWSWRLPAADWPPLLPGRSSRLTADQLKTCCLSSHCHTEGDPERTDSSHSADVAPLQRQILIFIFKTVEILLCGLRECSLGKSFLFPTVRWKDRCRSHVCLSSCRCG